MTRKSPILLIAFNRPDKTLEVFKQIKKYQPEKLFIAVDGPRTNNNDDAVKIEEVKKITNLVDWNCEVKTLFREENLGCKFGPIKAIDWFFENIEGGIILEDDCLPDLSFFVFCTELLNYYKDNEKIMHISGNNFQNSTHRGEPDSSYYFSKYTHNWGWATWKRAWESFNEALENFNQFDQSNFIKNIPIEKNAQNFWIKNFRQTIKGTDSWDSLWMYAVWYKNGLSVLPQKNLVRNIGFGNDATHTIEKNPKISTKSYSIENITHPAKIIQDENADNYTFKVLYYRPFLKRVTDKLKKMFKI